MSLFSCPTRLPTNRGLPALPTSNKRWCWWGENDEEEGGFPVRGGRDRKIEGDGFYEISRAGPFKIFTFQHAIPTTGPTQVDLDAMARWPGRYQIIYDTHYIADKEVYVYGDEKDSHGRTGLVLITGRDITAERSLSPTRRAPARGPQSPGTLAFRSPGISGRFSPPGTSTSGSPAALPKAASSPWATPSPSTRVLSAFSNRRRSRSPLAKFETAQPHHPPKEWEMPRGESLADHPASSRLFD